MTRLLPILALTVLAAVPPQPRFDMPSQYDGQPGAITGEVPPHIAGVEWWLHPGVVWDQDGMTFLAGDYEPPFELPASVLDDLSCGPYLITAHLLMDDGLWVGLLSSTVDFPPFDCPGDWTLDCRVDIADLLKVLVIWGVAKPQINWQEVGIEQLLEVLEHWGDC